MCICLLAQYCNVVSYHICLAFFDSFLCVVFASYTLMLIRQLMFSCNKKKFKKKNFISITCCISSAYILKYMIQLVIEGKIRRQICLYMIFPYETKLTYNEGYEE